MLRPLLLRGSGPRLRARMRVCVAAPVMRRTAAFTSTPIIVPAHNIIKQVTEYKQLPDDSQYIEKFYTELQAFQQEISTNASIPQSSFSEFEDEPNALITALEGFIQGKVLSKYAMKKEQRAQLVVKRYLEFLHNVKTTLVLNGGHTFIFDVLLQNQKMFEGFDKGRG